MGAPNGNTHTAPTSSSTLLQPPEEFCCPITGHLMRSPVTLVESYEVYDKKNLEEWFAQGNNTDPLSGVELTSHEVKPNTELRTQIVQWLQGEKARLAEQRKQAQPSQEPAGKPAPETDSRSSAPSSPAISETRAVPPAAVPVYPDMKPPGPSSPPISPAYPNFGAASSAGHSRDDLSPPGFPNAAGSRSHANAPISTPPYQPSPPPSPPSRRAAEHAQSFNYGGSPPKHSRDSSRAFSEPGQHVCGQRWHMVGKCAQLDLCGSDVQSQYSSLYAISFQRPPGLYKVTPFANFNQGNGIATT